MKEVGVWRKRARGEYVVKKNKCVCECALWNNWLFSGNGSRVLSSFLITTSTNTYKITQHQNNNALSTKYGTWLDSIMVRRLFVLQE